LKQASLSFIAGQLVSKTERESLAKTFMTFDDNNDGMISRNELKEGYAKMGKIVSDTQLESIFA